jgi:hypothetical protein
MDPLAREILDSARHAHDPTQQDRIRVKAKLAARIGAGAAVGAASGKVLGSGGAWVIKVVLPLLLVAGVGGYAYLHRGGTEGRTSVAEPPATVTPIAIPEPAQSSESPAPAEAASASASPAPDESASAAPPPPLPPPAPARSSHPAASDLEAEMAMLATAQAAIQRGDYATALAKLDEHQRTFPNGVLGEERTAARVVALCGAGRQAEARSLGAAFLARHPSSPLAPRVRSSCAAP